MGAGGADLRWAAPATGTITESLRRSASFDIATATKITMGEGGSTDDGRGRARLCHPGDALASHDVSGRASVKTCEKAATRERGES